MQALKQLGILFLTLNLSGLAPALASGIDYRGPKDYYLQSEIQVLESDESQIARAKISMELFDLALKDNPALFKRPKKCALHSEETKITEIANGLITVLNSIKKECSSNVEELNTIVSSLSEFSTSVDSAEVESTDEESVDVVEIDETVETSSDSTAMTSEEKEQFYGNIDSALGTLPNLSAKEKCEYSIKEQGLLPVIADVILNVSQLGLITPVSMGMNDQASASWTSGGLMIAAGGALLSSTLNVIHLLFKNRFDWDKAEDRDSFVQLNCSYHDLRNQLITSGAIHIGTKKVEEEKAKYLAYIAEIELYLEAFEKEKVDIEEFVAKNRKLKLESKMNPVQFATNGLLKEFKTEYMEASDFDIKDPGIDPGHKIHFLRGYYEMQRIMKRNLGDLVLDARHDQHLNANAMAFLEENFPEDRSKDESVAFFIENADHFSAIIDGYKEFLTPIFENLSGIEKEIMEEYDSWRPSGDKSTVEELEEIMASYTEQAAKLEEYKLGFNSRLDVYNYILGKEEFSSSDDGASPLHTALLISEEIKKEITGDQGESFLDYLVKDGRKEIKSVRKKMGHHLVDIRMLEKLKDRDMVSYNIEKDMACQDAESFILDKYNTASSFAELGYDFTSTIFSFIHSQGRKRNRFLLIPSGKSEQRKVYEHAWSAKIYTKIKSKEKVSYKYIKEFLGKNHQKKNLGRLMKEVDEMKDQVSEVQTFVHNSCHL